MVYKYPKPVPRVAAKPLPQLVQRLVPTYRYWHVKIVVLDDYANGGEHGDNPYA